MQDKKIITVFGATGAQGGGLAHAILNDPNTEFTVRAVTRDANSDKAQQLAQKGAEIVTGDIDDPAFLKESLNGAYGAYFVTFFWAHMSAEREMDEAKAMALAAKEAGLKHAIWSTLEDTREYVPLTDDRMPTLMGKYKVPHFDAKGESNKFFTEAGVPTTFLLTSFYYDNFIYFGMGPKKGEDGRLAITLPMGDRKLAMIAAEDIGKCAYGIFKRGGELVGKTVGIAGDHLSGNEMAQALTNALGQEIGYNQIPPEVFRSFGFPGADDLGNMFQFNHDFSDDFNKKRDIGFSKSLNSDLASFSSWLQKYGQQIPVG
ncbi:NmrA/HSCARG family protein [Segetibacter aerophilus]|uniref:Nucleotide-diphosphate-sugar epimerase n=1 Tax=Segetibacter aerophilus TaxID=670293 RepID=A0A512BHG5_9BACT|nr:NmrA/HSCARG family protein [Segetibacter aerophilus]GEO11400.1 nucleotide-diphosphate-sugar epimerase [Segetibacter aerophilus]